MQSRIVNTNDKSVPTIYVVTPTYARFGRGISKMVCPKKQDIWPRVNILNEKKIICRWMSVRQKFVIILENTVVQKLKLEKNAFTKKIDSWINILKWKNNENNRSIFDIENWLWKYEIFLFCFLLWVGMLILGSKSCFLGPTIFEIPKPNWYYITDYDTFWGL